MIEQLIKEEDVTKFVVGHSGAFDMLCAKALRSLREKYPHININLYVPYLTSSERDLKYYHNKKFDSITVADACADLSKRLYIVKCNEYMAEMSQYLICYVKNSYGVARRTLDYAKKRKHIKIYNLAER